MQSFPLLIQTPRLIIRPARIEDAMEIQKAKEEAWPDLQMWMSWAYDHQKPFAATEKYLLGQKPENPWCCALAFTKDTGELAVNGGLNDLGDGVFCTGYWCPRSMRGYGYAAEATNALIRYAFAYLRARQIDIDYFEGNEASARVVDRLGFTFSHTEKGGHKRCSDGTPLDVHHFAMTSPGALPPLDVVFKQPSV